MKEIIENTAGKFFTVTFVKKDGTIRKATGRTGVRKGTKGIGLGYNAADKGIKILWICDAENFRAIRLNSILSIKFKGKFYFNTVI
jgi:hypothetical protein